MAQCQKCGATLLQGYDHCTNCGTKIGAVPMGAPPMQQAQYQGQPQAPMGQYPPSGYNPGPQQPAPAKDSKSFSYGLAAKLDALGLVYMITGVVQVAYAVVTFISSVMLFSQAQNGLSKAIAASDLVNESYFRPFVSQYMIAIVAMILLAVIGVMNFLDGRKKQGSAQWAMTSPANVIDELTPVRPLLPAILRNGVFVLAMGLNVLMKTHIAIGLLGTLGVVLALYIRYDVMKNAQRL